VKEELTSGVVGQSNKRNKKANVEINTRYS
jgi:hypothetical protein